MSLLQSDHPVFRSCLYVPGHQPDRIARAYASEADAVILDLEDSVPPRCKREARDIVANVTAAPTPKPTYVRVNSPGSGLCDEDALAVVGVGLVGIRIAKTAGPGDVRHIAALLDEAGSMAAIHVLIESARALESAFLLATASPRVAMVGLGESDLRADLYTDSEGPTMDTCRARVIIASRAAGLPSPCQSVYPEPRDPKGLLATSKHGKRLGFIGRMAIHPAQVPIIHSVYTPKPYEIADAREICAAGDLAVAQNRSIVMTSKGRMVGPPAIATARQILQLASAFNLLADAT